MLGVVCLPAVVDAQMPRAFNYPTDPSDPSAMRSGQEPTGPTSAITVSFDEAVDDTTRTTQTSTATDPRFDGIRSYTSARAQIVLGNFTPRFGWQFGAGSSVLYYPSLQDVVRVNDNIDASVATTVGRRLHVQGRGSLAYSPYYSLLTAFSPDNGGLGAFDSVTAVQGAPSSVDFSAGLRSAYTTGADLGVTYDATRRSSLTLDGGIRRTDFVDAGDPNLQVWNARLRFQHLVTRNTGFHLGYGRREGSYSLSTVAAPAVVEDIDIGVDHAHPFSFGSDNLTIQITPGVSVTSDNAGRHFDAIGTASLVRTIGRTGLVGAQYDRQVRFVGGLAQPVFTDAIGANIGGSLTPSIAVSADAGYLFGHVRSSAGDTSAASSAATSTSNGYRALHASGRFSMALRSHLWLHVDYLLYVHQVGRDIQLIGPVQDIQRRQTLRAGLTLQFPLLGDRRIRRK